MLAALHCSRFELRSILLGRGHYCLMAFFSYRRLRHLIMSVDLADSDFAMIFSLPDHRDWPFRYVLPHHDTPRRVARVALGSVPPRALSRKRAMLHIRAGLF
jgi:hypothetical protein